LEKSERDRIHCRERFLLRIKENEGLRRTRMLILIILLLVLFGGGFFGYNRYGARGGLGIGGVILVILLLWLLLGGGLANLRM